MLQISSDVFRWIDIRDVISFFHYVLVSLCIFFCILYLYFCVYFASNVYDFILYVISAHRQMRQFCRHHMLSAEQL